MNLDDDLNRLRDRRLVVLFSIADGWTDPDIGIAKDQVNSLIARVEKYGLKMESKMLAMPLEGVFDEYDKDKTVFLNWCEGIGADEYDYATVPRELEKHGFLYTGSDSRCLDETTDKVQAKEVLIKNNLSTPKTKIYTPKDENGWSTFPALVKPARQHCSCGIDRGAVVDDSEQLHKRIEQMFAEYGPEVIVEDFIEGAEYNVAVWGNGEAMEMMPVGMIDYKEFSDYHDMICTYDAKWTEGSDAWNKTNVTCPAPMSEELEKNIRELALGTYKVFGIRDYGRVDIRVRGNQPFVLDVNSNPDISDDAGFARSAGVAGYDYGAMIIKLLSIAEARRV